MIRNTIELKNLAKKLLSKGYSKQSCFEALQTKTNNTKQLAGIIKNLPTNEAKNKYTYLQVILIILLSVKSLASITLGVIPYWDMACIAIAALWEFSAYFVIYALNGCVIIVSLIIFLIGIFEADVVEFLDIGRLTVIIGFSISIIMVAFRSEKKFITKPREKRILYYNKQGQKRIRIEYSFS